MTQRERASSGRQNIVSDARKVLVLRPDHRSLPANTRIVELLAGHYEGHELVIADIQPMIRRQRLVCLVNVLWVFSLYGFQIARGRKRLRQCFWRTPYIHRRIQKLVRKRYGSEDWLFTFQIQSLFDGAIPGTPHFVYTDHTHLANLDYPSFDPSDLYHGRWISCEREIYENAATTFVWSSNMIQVLTDRYGLDPRKALCVYAGPNIEVPELPERGFHESRSRVLFVGVDWERKGGPDMLEAFEKVRDAVPEATLTIVSAYCPDRQKWPENVEFTGKIPLPAVADYFSKADIFCLPTYVEPFGIVFIEAMAYAMPIISTRIGALPDLVEDGVNGFLIEPGDKVALANRLTELLANREMVARMATRGRERYDQSFSWQSVFAAISKRVAEHTGSNGETLTQSVVTPAQSCSNNAAGQPATDTGE